jgi:hypothetical protein
MMEVVSFDVAMETLEGFIGQAITSVETSPEAGPFLMLGGGSKRIWLYSCGWCFSAGDSVMLGSGDSIETQDAFLKNCIGLTLLDIVHDAPLMVSVVFSSGLSLYVFNTVSEDEADNIIFFDDHMDNKFSVSFIVGIVPALWVTA